MIIGSCYDLAAAGPTSVAEKEQISLSKSTDRSNTSNSGVEDLFKDISPITPVSEKPQKDVKGDIMSLFEKVCDRNWFLNLFLTPVYS